MPPLGLYPYRVQLVGGVVLHQGRIAEMKTGEGKTLVATLPAYLNALNGNGVHIVTVNDYLAKRDSEWMGKVHRFLGLTVGLIVHDLTSEERRKAYAADITYGTNKEMGFDYLRDNMAIYASELVQRGHAFAIVDEVDSILIDEARTPLIISGMGEKSTEMYSRTENLVRGFRKKVIAESDDKEEEDVNIDADYIVDEKAKTATLTARGVKKAEEYFGLENLSDPENSTIAHHINQAIKAHGVMKRDIDYVVKDGEVIIVDEFTGRLMFGRRYSNGLHQAIEAKEHVTVASENKTLATITFQNYFRLYDKLSGMTGTAMTEQEEFGTIYELDIVEIPIQIDGLGVGLNGVLHLGQIVSVDKGGGHAELGQGVLQQVVAAAVDGLLCHDVVTGLCQRLDGVGDGGSAGSGGQSSHAALQSSDTLLEHILRGVGQAAVDVARIGQTETVSGVLAVAEHIGSGLVDGHGAGIGCGIGLLLANVKLQGLKFIVRHSN